MLLERGWLSSNNLLCLGEEHTALIDTGYATQSQQTLALVQRVLAGRRLDQIVNTHLHSDHCGGNATLQAAYPEVRTCIPPGQSAAVRAWDEQELSYESTGQSCPRFVWQGLMQAGDVIPLGAGAFEVHAAPGHDPHAVVLFEPRHRLLVSGDALWQRGFGVVFPELQGEPGFQEVSATLDLIECLEPRVVIPGHGSAFTDVASALAEARNRLRGYQSDPVRHARHAIKVLLMFKLMELQRTSATTFVDWALQTPHVGIVHARYFSDVECQVWIRQLLYELTAGTALQISDDVIRLSDQR